MAYHVIARFIEQRFFLDTPNARETYLRLLGRSLGSSDWTCTAYALMSNHVHLQLRAGRSTLEQFLKPVHCPFANWLNVALQRIGPVFAGRAKSIAFLDENLEQLTAYIHNNPVRAGVVSRASESGWTSHRAYVGRAPGPPWLDTSGSGRSRADFDAFVRATPGTKVDPDPAGLRIELARYGALDFATPAVAKGGAAFPIVTRRAARVRVALSSIVHVVAETTGITPSQICSRQKVPSVVRARRLVAVLSVNFGLTTTQLSDGLGISVSASNRLAKQSITGRDAHVARLARERLELESWAQNAD